MLGTSSDFPSLRHFQPEYGRFFTDEEMQRKELVCLLGRELAGRLFPAPEMALGRTVSVSRSVLRVIGVMEAKGMDPGGLRMDELLIVPLTTFMQRFAKQDHLSGAWLGLRDRNELTLLETSLDALLREHHRLSSGKRDFTLAFAEQVDEFVSNALRLVRTLGMIGAGISFAIGTLGILSVMTLLVRARRLEIGMRRVVGATRRQILAQFIGEAALMSVAGGLFGVASALSLCAVIALTGALPGYFSFLISFGVLSLSICCGMIAGAYPAWKASRTDVLQTLRTI
jgi:putative ABC transport system permease protein